MILQPFFKNYELDVFLQAEKITTLLKAANVSIESYWAGLFAKLAEKKNIDDLILNVGAGGGGGAAPAVSAPAAGGGGAAAAAPAAEEKKVSKYIILSNHLQQIVFSLLYQYNMVFW